MKKEELIELFEKETGYKKNGNDYICPSGPRTRKSAYYEAFSNWLISRLEHYGKMRSIACQLSLHLELFDPNNSLHDDLEELLKYPKIIEDTE